MRAYVLLLIAVAVAVSVWRFHTFDDIDLRADQAAIMVWLQNIHDAERALPMPLPDASWLKSLEADERSFLNVVLKPIYTGHQHIFMVVTVSLLAAVMLFTGTGFAAQLGVTVISAGLVIVAVGLFPLALPGISRSRAIAMGAASASLVAMNSFLNIFAAFSVHNVAVALMVGAMAVVACWVAKGDDRRALGWAVTASLIAIYSNHANVLFVPTTAVVAVLVSGTGPFSTRIARAFRYGCWIIVGLIPPLVLVAVTKARGLGIPNKQDFSALLVEAFRDPSGDYWAYLPARAWGWLEAMDGVFSGAGLLLGAAGLLMLAMRYRVRVPLVFVALQFLICVLLPIVTQYDRTAAYVVPMLALGVGVAMVEALAGLRSRDGRLPGPAVVMALAAVMVFAGHATRDVPRLINPERTLFWGKSLDSRGLQKAMTADIERLLPGQVNLVPLNTAIGQRFQALRTRPVGEITIFKPLDLLARRKQAGTLDDYIRDRRLVLDKARPLFILANDRDLAPTITATVAATLCHSVLARCGTARLEEIGRWKRTHFMLGAPVLYRLIDN